MKRSRRLSFGLLVLACALIAGGWQAQAGSFEVTDSIYRELPFLKPGLRFWHEYPGNNPGHGELHALYAELPDGRRVAIKTSEDLTPLIAKIATAEEALQWVRVLSKKGHPWTGNYRLDYFQDIPFVELEASMGSIAIPQHVLARYPIPTPQVSTSQLLNGTKQFVIRRAVFLVEQLDRLWEGHRDVTEIGRATETVEESGAYRFELERIPVEGFEVNEDVMELD